MTKCSTRCAHWACRASSVVKLIGRNVKMETFVLAGKYTAISRRPLVRFRVSTAGLSHSAALQPAPVMAANTIDIQIFFMTFLFLVWFRSPRAYRSEKANQQHLKPNEYDQGLHRPKGRG